MIAQGFVLLGFAILVFALAFAVHVIVWRMSAATPSGFILITLVTLAIVVECLLLPFPWATRALIGTIALEIAACYVISYPAMQANSPSLAIARELTSAGPNGLTRAELYARLAEASLVADRIEDLVKDGLVANEGGRLRCTRRGALIGRTFARWKGVLREPKGG